MEDIAVDLDRVLAKQREVDHCPQAATDEALDLLGAAGLLPSRGLTLHARTGRARQHAVLRGEPALPLALEERRHLGLDTRSAYYARVATLDKHGALGVAREPAGDPQGPQFIGGTSVSTHGWLVEIWE